MAHMVACMREVTVGAGSGCQAAMEERTANLLHP
jgi:hypothetical protein